MKRAVICFILIRGILVIFPKLIFALKFCLKNGTCTDLREDILSLSKKDRYANLTEKTLDFMDDFLMYLQGSVYGMMYLPCVYLFFFRVFEIFGKKKRLCRFFGNFEIYFFFEKHKCSMNKQPHKQKIVNTQTNTQCQVNNCQPEQIK